MPELPEVETVRRGLARLIVGKKIVHVSHDTPKSFPNPADEVEQFMIGATITAVYRRAKVLLTELDSGYTLVTHLKMTGQLVYIEEELAPPLDSEVNSESSPHHLKLARGARAAGGHVAHHVFIEHEQRERPKDRKTARVSQGTTGAISRSRGLSVSPSCIASQRFGGGHPNDSLVGELPDKSTRVIIEFACNKRGNGPCLFFNDQRKFGWMRLVPTISVPEIDFMKRVGPEPLDDDFTGEVLYGRLQRRKNTSIKAALLDQSVVAGIGNIYADESLWGAKIHPATLVRDIAPSSIFLLHSQIISVLKLSIEKGGSTDKNYVDAEGRRGSYLSFANVFRQNGQPCPRCGRLIEKLRVAGRGTHICPHCQQI